MYSWFPRNRCAIAMILCIPPLIGCFLLLKLPASAGWGVVVSSWLVSVLITVRLWATLTDPGFLYHCAMVYVAQSECLEHQRKYQTQCCQCCVLHRLLRRMYRISAIVETLSALLLWSGHGHRHLVLAYHYDWFLVGPLQKGKSKAGRRRGGTRDYADGRLLCWFGFDR